MSLSDRPVSRMSREVAEIPQAAARLLQDGREAIAQVAAAIDMARVSHAVVSGRGSSGHAGTYLRYLIETRLGSRSVRIRSELLGHEADPEE